MSVAVLDTPTDSMPVRRHSVSKSIALGQDCVTVVDDADYEWLSQWDWNAQKYGEHWEYVGRSERRNGKKKTILMHRQILGLVYGSTHIKVDHINHDGLDNRRTNLRVASNAQNAMNRFPNRESKNPYKGVRLRPSGKWEAFIKLDYKYKYLGLFENPEDAAKTYDVAALELFGEFARLNFPPGGVAL